MRVNVVLADFIGPATARPDLTVFRDDTLRQQLITVNSPQAVYRLAPGNLYTISQELAQRD